MIHVRDLNLERYSVASFLTQDFFPLLGVGVPTGLIAQPAVFTGDEQIIDEPDLECSEILTSPLFVTFKDS